MFRVHNSFEQDLKLLLWRYLLLLVFCTLFSLILAPQIWEEAPSVYHIILDLITVFIAFFTFGIMWLTYDHHPGLNRFAGFGLAAAGLFDLAHISTFPDIQYYLGQDRYFDLSIWYLLLSKFVLTISLLIGASYEELKITKRRGLLITLFLTCFFLFFINFAHNYVPLLLMPQGLTPLRMLLVTIVITLLLLIIIELRLKLFNQEVLIYRYAFFAVLLAISGEICLLAFNSIESPHTLAGDFLKIFSYCYLCKAIIISGIIHPFNQLEEWQDSYSQILESLPMGIIRFNKKMVITLVNSAALNLLNCESKDILGLTHIQAADLFSDNTRSCNGCNNHKQLDSFWPTGNYITEIVDLHGSPKKLSLTPYKLDEGYITVLNEAGKEQEYENLQEQQQNKRLVLLGQMAAGIVHEIRNPLTAVKGFSQIISRLASDEKIKECSRLIDQETDSLNRVLTDFLRFARPRNPVMQEMELNQVISSLEMMIESNAFLKKVNICFSYTPEDTRVLADAEQIKQVVLNLVQNSIEATGDVANAWITISTGCNKNINEAYISVIDNGIGMTGEDILKIGRPFYTTKEKGTGLGMNMCFQIVKEHGGSINIESKPQKGTTVTIYLPRFIRSGEDIVSVSA